MRIYLAAVFSSNRYDVQGMTEYPHMLESYHYVKLRGFTDKIRNAKRKVFLDSGAYSAFTQNAVIDIKEYAQYILKNRDIIEFAANLDDLSGDKVAAAERTWENQRKLEELVPKEASYIIPVYHVREPPSVLDRLTKKYPFIAIGGMVPESAGDLRELLDDIWDRQLTDKRGAPIVRVHGFGMTTFDLMQRYPWWSVDSTSWVIYGAMGWALVVGDHGRIARVNISNQSPKRRELDQHFDTVSPIHQDILRRVIESKGFTVEELQQNYKRRDAFNITVYKDIMGTNAKTFKKHKGDLFA